MKTRLTMKSRNVKTGNIPVSTTERNSCPSTCPLQKNGCYADGGPLALVWDQVTTIGDTWSVFCKKIKALPAGQLWRHNQAGDLPHQNGAIDKNKMEKLVNANVGKRGFTYTHHNPTILENALCIGAANIAGFTVNLSANNLDEADALKMLGFAPVVVVLPIDQTENTKTPNGHKVTVCPAAIDKTDTINCKTCKLCAIATRNTIIGFPAHGVKKRHVSEMVSA